MRWVLLRGLTREAGHWGGFPRQLAATLGAGHEVVALDLPGNGSGHRLRSPASVAQLAQACRGQLAAQEPCVLVAMSLGAMVAIEWARAAPPEVAGAILINTSAGGHGPPWERLQPGNYLTLAGLAWPGLPPARREQRVLAMTSGDPQRHAGIVAEWARLAAARPVSAGNALRQLLAAALYRAPRTRPPVPMLLLACAGDRLVSPKCSQRMARRWNVPLRMHPWAGHDLPLDDPAWLLQEIHAWAHREASSPHSC
jgi:pimeloyl-ACP methyl ester carboxylesterase